MNILESFRAFWAERRPREQALLSALAIFVIAALLAQLLWSSHQARVRLKDQVPRLRQQLETMQRKTSELQQLRTQPQSPVAADAKAVLAAARSAALAAGIGEAASQFQTEGPGRLRVRATLPFDRWLAWAGTLQRDGRLRLVSCRIEAAESAGFAKIDALFSVPEPG